MEGVYEWAKQHPWMAGALTLGAIFILLWLLGFFGSSSSSSTSSNSNNLAAAYYAAEAAQTTAGTQLQMATEAYGAQTAQDQIQANAAEGIASTQANMYTTIGGQNASAETTINAQDNAVNAAMYNDQLLATENSNDDALSASNTAAYYGYQTSYAADQANVLGTAMNTIIPQELALTSGYGNFYLPGYGTASVNTGAPTSINTLTDVLGYTPAEANVLAGFPPGGVG